MASIFILQENEGQLCSLVGDKTTTLQSHSTRRFSWFLDPIQASPLHSQHTMADLPPFTYTPLLANEIRLLTPVIEDDNIAWTLFTVQLDSRDLKFETLSYVWGSQDESFPIVCNKKLFWVHHNLHTALPYLARRANPDEVLPIWIDAICINQNDDEEKVVQIRSMNQIYRRASRMWIWMGIAEHPGCIPDAISTLSWLKQLNQDPSNSARVRGPSPKMFHLDPSVHKAVMHLIANPWYRRLWVTQELVLSNYTVALCGEYEISIDLLRDAQWPLQGRRIGSNLKLSLDEIFDVWTSNRIFSAVSPGKKLSEATSTEEVATLLICVANLSLYQQCLQPRDRVLGLLGLFDMQNTEIPIEDFYSCTSIPELYTKFSAFLLTNALCDPDMIPYIWTWFDKASVPGKLGYFPSWVPDLHHMTFTVDRWSVIHYAPSNERDYKASRKLKSIRRGYKYDELKISGRLLDSVVGVSLPRPTAPVKLRSSVHIIRWWNDIANWEDDASYLTVSDTEDSLHDFCLTLVGGHSCPGEGIDPCLMRHEFHNNSEKARKLYEDLRIEERYSPLLFLFLLAEHE
jgi:hypothetical protein